MSDANDSKDLDKYGVWVKDTPKDIKGEDLPENALDDIDLPSDDDMFNDIEFPLTAEDLKEGAPESESGSDTEISDLDIDIDIPAEDPAPQDQADQDSDTTLNPDELMNITADMEGGADENADTTLSPDELSNITVGMEGADDENADTTLSPDELMNITGNQEIPTEEAAGQEIDGLDDFNIDGLDITDQPAPAADTAIEEPAVEETAIEEPSAEEPKIEEPSAEQSASQEISLDDIPDGEIDLDDFMSDSSSGGSSDAAAAPDGDVDLSAFMDGDDGDVDLSAFMDDAPSAKKEPKPEEIQDERSLDIDVSFDDSAEGLAQEDTSDDNPPPAPAPEAKEQSADDMFDSFGKQKPAPAAASQDLGGSTEEIDLSDFGFDDDDANIGMTNGPDGGEQAKKEVVDYDMKVSADDDSKTPSVQDVVMGNIDSSEETEFDETEASGASSPAASAASSMEVNEAGKEILNQIMGELSSLKDEIKNLKNDFAELKDRPSPAAETASIPAAAPSEASKEEENTGFFGSSDDEDDTIALSGNELTNILSSAEFSTEDASEADSEEPVVMDTDEPVFEETSVAEPSIDDSALDGVDMAGGDITMQVSESDMEEPTIDTTEITPEDLAGTTDEFGEENVLPEEISVPKIDDDIAVESSSSDLMDSVVNTDEATVDFEEPQEHLNEQAIDEIMQEDVSISDSLDDEKIEYMQQDSDVVSVDDIVKENVSLQEDSDNVAVGVGDDIDAAFEEADATESEIADDALAQKDAYETSVNDIMKENISLQEDSDDVAVGVGDDIDAAFEEADATESDIADDALAQKDAYENSKSMDIDEEFSLDDEPSEDPVPDTLDPSLLAAPSSETESSDDEIDMSIFDETEEPAIEETAVEEPSIDATVAAPAAAAATAAVATAAKSADTTSISKELKTEIVSVLSYMDQLLENLPEDKITEFAKSEHFVTYKKLFDELGLS